MKLQLIQLLPFPSLNVKKCCFWCLAELLELPATLLSEVPANFQSPLLI